jgi:hypothetical protein
MSFDILAFAPKPPTIRRKTASTGSLSEHLNSVLRNLPTVDPEELVEYASFFGDQARWSFLRQIGQERQEWRLRPSDQKCSRQSWYKRMGKEEIADTGKFGTFLFGDVAEAFAVTILHIAGVDVVDYQTQVTIPTGLKEDTFGTTDLLIKWGGHLWLVDVKSASSWSFEKAQAGLVDDAFGYKKQIKTYLMAPELMALGVDRGMLLFFNKETGRQFCEVPVPPPTTAEIQEWKTHCKTVMGDTEPDRPVWAITDLRPRLKVLELADVRCRYCPFIHTCWGEGWEEETPGGKKWRKKA